MENKETDLIKDNIIKDRRRRYLYLSKDRTSGVQVMEQELAKFTLLKKMSMWALLIFLIPFGILKQSLSVSLIIGLSVYVAGTLYFHLLVLKDRTEIKLTQTEFDKLNSPELIKAERNNILGEILIPLLVVLILFSRALDLKNPITELEMTITKISIAALIGLAAYQVPSYMKFRKRYKETQSGNTKKSKTKK